MKGKPTKPGTPGKATLDEYKLFSEQHDRTAERMLGPLPRPRKFPKPKKES